MLAVQNLPNVVDVEAQFRRWFQLALNKHALGERFSWSCGVMQLPTPANGINGQFAFISVIALWVSTPSQVLETTVDQHAQIGLLGLTEEGVDKMTQEIVASLREGRRRQPEAMAAAGAEAASNGRMPPGRGIILPGQ